MKQNFEVDKIGDFHARSLEGEINCQHCNGDSMHHVKIDIFDCDEDKTCDMNFSLKLKTFGGKFTKPVDNNVVNPSSRRGGIVIQLQCESCHEISYLKIVQHKGITIFKLGDK